VVQGSGIPASDRTANTEVQENQDIRRGRRVHAHQRKGIHQPTTVSRPANIRPANIATIACCKISYDSFTLKIKDNDGHTRATFAQAKMECVW
jgi:hypothetical protein